MAVTLPIGWTDFNSGSIDPLLCETVAVSLSATGDLNCDLNQWTATIEAVDGAPPFTFSTTAGQLVTVDDRTVTLNIDSGIAISPERCSALVYGYSASAEGFNPDLCQTNAAPWCVVDYYNCFGQWIQWTPINGLFDDDCWDKVNGIPGPSFPRLGRAFNCPPCNDNGIGIGVCDVPADCSAVEVLNKEGVNASQTCNSTTLLDLQLPALTPPFFCFDPFSIDGQNYTNFGSTSTIGAGSLTINDETTILRIAAEIHIHKEDAFLFFDDVAAQNTGLNGCAPCAMLQGSDIIVTVTDGTGQQAIVVLPVA